MDTLLAFKNPHAEVPTVSQQALADAPEGELGGRATVKKF